MYLAQSSRIACACAATSILLCGPASAGQRHKVAHGESLLLLAHRYHVSVRSIAEANGLSDEDAIREGRLLLIPDGSAEPRSGSGTAVLKADNVLLRSGPGESHKRIALLDVGARLKVERSAGDWTRVSLADGRSGWVRSDFVHARRATRPVALQSAHTRAIHHAAIVARHETRRPQHAQRIVRAHPHEADRASATHHVARVARAQERAHASQTARHVAGHPHGRVARSEQHHERASEPVVRTARRDDLIRTAFAYRGTPYRTGGSGSGGFDCSGFTRFIYGQHGVSLPHSARAQFGMGQHVDRGGMKPGDLVFFHTVTPGISHVGMYIGNGKFVHSSSRRTGGVRVDSLNDGYYRQAFRGARRVK